MFAPSELAGALAGIALISGVGRVALSWFPAGPTGSHRLRALPLTWAASYLLGLVLLGAQALTFFGTPEAKNLLLLFGPWAVLLGLRLATLPAAFVPRHEYGEPPWTGVDRIWLAGILIVGAWLLYAVHTGDVRWENLASSHGNAPPDWYSACTGIGRDLLVRLGVRTDEGALTVLASSSLIAWMLCFHEGLSRALRRRPWRLAWTAAVFAGPVLFAHPGVGINPLWVFVPHALAAAGGSFLVPWVRRGDRRSMMLSAVFFSGAALQREVPFLALSGLAPLVAFTAPGSRKDVFLSGVTAFCFLALAPWVLERDKRALSVHELVTIAVLLTLWSLVTWFLFRWARSRHERTDWNREASALIAILVVPFLASTAGLAHVVLSDSEVALLSVAVLAFAPSFPFLTLLVGLTLLPAWPTTGSGS